MLLKEEMALARDNLKEDEGFRSKPYKCTAGRLTVGYGTNLDVGISQAQAEAIMVYEVERLFTMLASNLKFFNRLKPKQRVGLVNMAYQLGLNGLLGFKKALAALEQGSLKKAEVEFYDSKWAKSDSPARAKRVIKQICKV